jgi:hypothetical protein
MSTESIERPSPEVGPVMSTVLLERLDTIDAEAGAVTGRGVEAVGGAGEARQYEGIAELQQAAVVTATAPQRRGEARANIKMEGEKGLRKKSHSK